MRTDGVKRVRIARKLSRLCQGHKRRNFPSTEQIQDSQPATSLLGLLAVRKLSFALFLLQKKPLISVSSQGRHSLSLSLAKIRFLEQQFGYFHSLRFAYAKLTFISNHPHWDEFSFLDLFALNGYGSDLHSLLTSRFASLLL